LEKAAIFSSPTLYADGAAAAFNPVGRGGSELRAHRGQRPTCRFQHAHRALAIDHDGEISGITGAGDSDVQDLFGPV